MRADFGVSSTIWPLALISAPNKPMRHIHSRQPRQSRDNRRSTSQASASNTVACSARVSNHAATRSLFTSVSSLQTLANAREVARINFGLFDQMCDQFFGITGEQRADQVSNH